MGDPYPKVIIWPTIPSIHPYLSPSNSSIQKQKINKNQKKVHHHKHHRIHYLLLISTNAMRICILLSKYQSCLSVILAHHSPPDPVFRTQLTIPRWCMIDIDSTGTSRLVLFMIYPFTHPQPAITHWNQPTSWLTSEPCVLAREEKWEKEKEKERN